MFAPVDWLLVGGSEHGSVVRLPDHDHVKVWDGDEYYYRRETFVADGVEYRVGVCGKAPPDAEILRLIQLGNQKPIGA